ncbi:hypothetical protein HYW54_00470 [Candidatus Gottesmanbacteria bacterium]|nr:hypothetical protein [Candidatus Gottesmanbacteria bacterium]
MFEKLRHWFTPHHTNNHKPRALHPQAFVFYILLIFVVQVSLKTVRDNFPNILGYATDISVEALVSLTNQKRQEAGLTSLSVSPTLSAAAAGKAQDMFSQGYWAHIAPDGKTPWDFITGSGYSYSHAGENLAKDFNDSSTVVNAWMASPTHRDNILKSEYQEIGFAVVNGNLNGAETTLVVQMFGSPVGGSEIARVNTVAQAAPLPTKEPLPTPIIELEPTAIPIVAQTRPNPPSQIRVAGATLPLINIISLSKTIALVMVGFLLLILAIDSIFIWKRRTIRVAGHNFAHMLFLLALIGVIYFTGTGIIL